ncbi:hypothetical protein ACFE04_025493 [Oxalis oulophora]
MNLIVTAKSVGLPYLSAYLDSMGTNFTHGANFATSASTIRLPLQILPRGGFSPFYLNIQFSQFVQLRNRSHSLRQQEGVFKELMPREDFFEKALYTIDIGQNDLGEGFFSNKSIREVNASIPDILASFSANVASLYQSGARSFWIHNTGPIGCLPYILTNFPTAKKDSAGCAEPHNEVCQHFNLKLKETVIQFRKEFSLAAFTYVDVYSIKYSLFPHPEKHGFELPLVACCGYGGKYNFNSAGTCGSTINVNGSEIFAAACEHPSARVNWDGYHYTDAANKFIFDQISTGAFSDPPITLNLKPKFLLRKNLVHISYEVFKCCYLLEILAVFLGKLLFADRQVYRQLQIGPPAIENSDSQEPVFGSCFSKPKGKSELCSPRYSNISNKYPNKSSSIQAL